MDIGYSSEGIGSSFSVKKPECPVRKHGVLHDLMEIKYKIPCEMFNANTQYQIANTT